MHKITAVGLVLAVALGFSLLGCQDRKARQENEQLKAQVFKLQQENGGLGNRIDVLTTENVALREENERLKARHPKTKTQKRKHHQTSSKQATSGQN